jgi:O-antigen/teichoic acid export membrane protein
MTGTTIAMVIPVVASPALTRLYSPRDYGVFAVFVSIISIIAVPITANYDSAVMLPKKDEDAMNLVGVCLAVSLFVGTGLLLLSWLLTGEAARLLGNRHISTWLPLVPVTAFIMGLHQTLSYWANRKRQFGRLGKNRVVESVVTPLLTLALGFRSWGLSGLIAGLMGGKIAAAGLLARSVWSEKRRSGLSLGKKAMFEQAGRYSDFPLYSAPTSVLDIAALQVPVFLLTRSFGPGVVGLFALTTRVIGAPLALVSQCVAQVYFQWVAEGRHGNGTASNVFKIAGYLVLLVSGPVIAIVLLAPSLFSLIFGAQWRVAGEYARILVFPLAVKFVVSPLSVIMPATGNIRLGSLWKTIYFLSTCVVLYVASRFQAKTFLYLYSIHDSAFYVYYFSLVVKASASTSDVPVSLWPRRLRQGITAFRGNQRISLKIG